MLYFLSKGSNAKRLQNIKEGIEGKPVRWYSDVFSGVFPNLDREAANSLWKKELKKPKDIKEEGRAIADLDGEEAEEEER